MALLGRRSRSALLALAMAAGLASATGLPAPAAAAAAPTTQVDPATLAEGPTPTLPHFDGDRIVNPAGRTVTGVRPGELLRARGGYLVESARGETRVLTFVSHAGRQRRIYRGKAFGAVLTTANGRAVVLSSDPYRRSSEPTRVRVLRVTDGRLVAARAFAARSAVMAAGRGQVLVQQPRTAVAWTTARDTVRRLATTRFRQRLSAPLRTAPTASLAARRFVARVGARDEVRDLRTTRLVWRTAKGESVISFSPDDRRVLTVDDLQGANYDGPWDQSRTLRVRAARTGKVLRVFRGHFAGAYTSPRPAWDDDRTLLLFASGPFVADDYRDASLIRCSAASGACTRVPDHVGALLQRKSN